MSDCIFCDIAQKKTRAQIVLENDSFIAFENINPQAPIHVLVIPKEHIEKEDAMAGKKPAFWSDLFLFANEVIHALELHQSGYRLVNNGAGYHAINHEHLHILGGKGFKPKDKI